MAAAPPRTLVLATRNRHKLEELSALFVDLPLAKIMCADDFPDMPDVVEDGETLEANALKKAREVAQFTGHLSIADDTGLEVDALDGAPGVYAARYAGEDVSYEDNWRKLLAELARREASAGPISRAARFVTVMALVDPHASGSPVERVAEGALAGEILAAPRGEGGFGYDPVFLVPEAGETLAEMSAEQKNRISHRARASVAMLEILRDYLAAR